MKNKKKIVSLFFLLLLIFSSVLALSSCGQSETNRERLEKALSAKVSEELYTRHTRLLIIRQKNC